jgi:UDP-glucose 4-epimerase
MNVINAAVRGNTRRLIFTSSIAVYGAGQTPMTEDMAPRPEDPYGIAKYAVELDLHAAARMFGLEFTIFRPHNVYGDRQNITDPYRNVLGIFMNRLLRDEPLPIFGTGEQRRAFTHVDDIVEALVMAALLPAACNETFNIGADTVTTVNDLAALAAAAFDEELRTVHYPARVEADVAYASHGRCRQVFGSQQETSLAAGVERMAAFVRQNPRKRPTKSPTIEIPQGIPPAWTAISGETGIVQKK